MFKLAALTVIIAAVDLRVAASALPIEALEKPIVIPHPIEVARNNSADSLIIDNQYIVRLKSGVSVAAHHENFLESFVAKHSEYAAVRHTFDFDESLSGYSLQLDSDAALQELLDHPEVEEVEPNQLCSIVSTTQNSAPWNLARLSSRDDHTNEYRYDSRAGSGVDAYVVDTGINVNHREFEGRAIWGANYARNERENDDNNGHGTHVAGIIGAKTWGVAKNVRLIAVKVLDKSGRGPWDQVLAGLNWAYSRFRSAGRRAVINISISGPRSSSLNYAVSKLVSAGMHVVVAAGNDHTNACNESPASATSALVIGSIGQSDRFSSFSNYGSCVDLLAPGEGIVSTWRGSTTALAVASGTSMASPHAAGVKAIYLARRNYSPASLDYQLRKTATKYSVSGVPRGSSNYLLYSPSDMSLAAGTDDGYDSGDDDSYSDNGDGADDDDQDNGDYPQQPDEETDEPRLVIQKAQ